MIAFTDTARFARDLGGLLQLGYTLEEAVMKSAECQSPKIQSVAGGAVPALQKGQTLSRALEPAAHNFPLFYRLLCSAEEGGRLPEGLLQSAEIMEDVAERKSQTFLTVLYPCVIFTLVLLGAVFLLLFCGGLFEQLFYSMNLTLPAATKMFLFLCHLVRTPIGLLLVALPLVLMWCVVFGKTPFAGWLYHLPIYGSWLKQNESIIFLSVTGQLIEHGTPLTEACELAAGACAPPVAARLKNVAERLRAGDKLSQALAGCNFVPELAVWVVGQREKTEHLRLRDVSALLQRELDCSTQMGNFIWEPMLFILVMLGMSFFITAVFLPLYQLIGNLG